MSDNEKNNINNLMKKVKDTANNVVKEVNEHAIKRIQEVDWDEVKDTAEKEVKVAADKAGDAAKQVVDFTKDTKDKAIIAYKNFKSEQEKRAYEKDRKVYPSFYLHEMNKEDFQYPKLIYINNDNKRVDERIGEGANGYFESQKLLILHTDEGDAEITPLKYFPQIMEGVYLQNPNPLHKKEYIMFDYYFDFMQDKNLNELELIAQQLGATHFSTSLSEEKKKFAELKVDQKNKANILGVKAGADADVNIVKNEEVIKKVVQENNFSGKEPKRPELDYLANNNKIKQLIDLRMNPENPIKNRKVTITLTEVMGINRELAGNIDATFKKTGIKNNTSITSEYENQTRREFEYLIDFETK